MLRSRFQLQNHDFGASVGAIGIVFRDLFCRFIQNPEIQNRVAFHTANIPLLLPYYSLETVDANSQLATTSVDSLQQHQGRQPL